MWVILKECPNLGIEMKMTTYWYALCPTIPHNIHFPYVYVVNFHHKDYHLKSVLIFFGFSEMDVHLASEAFGNWASCTLLIRIIKVEPHPLHHHEFLGAFWTPTSGQ